MDSSTTSTPGGSTQIRAADRDEDVPERALDFAWQTYDAVSEWIRFADAKAGAVLAVLGVAASIALTDTAGLQTLFNANRVVAWLFGLGMLSSAFAVAASLWCLMPRRRPCNAESLIFYDSIARIYGTHPDGYCSALRSKAAEDRLLDEVAAQIASLSVVACAKYRAVRLALWGGAITLGLASLSLLVLVTGETVWRATPEAIITLRALVALMR